MNKNWMWWIVGVACSLVGSWFNLALAGWLNITESTLILLWMALLLVSASMLLRRMNLLLQFALYFIGLSVVTTLGDQMQFPHTTFFISFCIAGATVWFVKNVG
jgi:hypothetical protein